MQLREWFGCGAALAASILGTAAHAAIVVGNTAVASPVAATGFETFASAPINTTYADGGVDAVYVSGNPDDFTGVGTTQLATFNGVGDWSMIDNHGYTALSLTGGGTFTAFSGLFGSENDAPTLDLVFRLGGATVGEVDNLNLSTTGTVYSFSGFTADTVWAKGQFGGGVFSATQNDRLGLDDVAFGNAAGGVPEPAAWTLMIAGFGMAGGLLRRSRRPAVA